MSHGHPVLPPSSSVLPRCVHKLFLSLASLLVFALAGGTGWLQGQQALQVLHSHVRPQVANGTAAFVSAMPADQQLSFSIVLPLRNQAGLTSLLARLYDPTSPDYRHFLTVSQFTDQFGPTASDYQAVRAFAQANGFTLTGDPANRLVVSLTGSVAQIESAFNVKMNVYQHPTEKRTFFSLDREPSLQLGAPVLHIAGLDSYSIPRHMSERPKGAQANTQQPQTASVTGSGPGGSYLGSDMRAAYYGGTQLDGNGQAVGLLEFGGYELSDVNSTFSNAAQTYIVPVNNVLLDGATGAPENDSGAEAALDIVQAIGMAPNLTQVRVYIGIGQDDSTILNAMASENLAKQLSCSWGWRPADPTVDDVFFQEMAAQGQTFFTASGDSGAYDAAINPFFYPAEDPYVTTVGGTHLTTNGMAGSWASEAVWNSQESGSGGGISPDGLLIPAWQAGLATSANGGSNTYRNSPDVAMEADFDNYACSLGTCDGDYAGTSFAAPRWAGFMALVNQQAVEAGTAPMGGLGFLNTTLYQLAQGADAANDLHDIVSGNNNTDNQPTWFSAVVGYDLTTGWGSANGQSLINDLAGQQVPGFWVASSQTTVALNPGGSGTTIVSITDAGSFAGAVNLAVSGLPSGVTASFSPSSTTGTSVLTLTASSTITAETGTITITGTSGSLTASANITVAVHTPTFALSASPATLGVNLGASGASTIAVTPQFGFTGSVTLAASGLPTGVTASFSTNPATGTSTLTLNASSTAAGGTSTITITGTSGSLSATTTIALTIQAPSFSLTSSSTASIGQGSSGYGYVYVQDLYGFNGNVTLAVSGLPTGVTAAFSPNPATSSSTLTFTASSAAALGQSTVTITGTSGTLSATTNITLGIYAPTFTLFGSNSVSVGQGASASGYVYVEGEYGFNSAVTLSVAGLPNGVTASFNPNPATYESSLTFAATSAARTGQYPLTITGVSGTQTATTNMTLGVYVPTFTLTASSVSMGTGTTASSYAYVSPQYGFTGSVSLALSGLPSGVTASITPNPTTGSSTIALQASSSATLGQYTVTLTGTSGTQTVSTTFTLGIYTPTFTLYSGGNASLGQGSSTTSFVEVETQYGFTGSVNLAVSGLPAGVTASFSPNPTTGYSTLTLQAASTAALGQYTLTITGTSGSQSATTNLTLGVYTPTFTLFSGGSVSLGQGATTTTYVDITPQYGFTGSVTLAVSGLPSGVTASFSPNPTTGYSTLTLQAASTAALGQYTLTITGTSGSQSATTNLTLGVFTPTFTLSSNGSATVGQGASSTTYVYVYSQYGFSGSVSFSIAGLPSGVTASFSPNPSTGTSTLTLNATSAAAIGQYTLTITGTSGSQTATTLLTLGVYAPTFTLASYASVNLGQGSSGSAYVYVTPQYGFTGAVNLAVSGLPSGVTASFSPNPATGTSLLTLIASSAAATGSATLTITGTYGSQTVMTTLPITVYAPSFTIYSSLYNASLNEGASTYGYVYITDQYGFSGNVTFNATGLPAGVTAAFSTNPATSSTGLTLTAGSAATPGIYTVTVTGTSGSVTASTTFTLTINAPAFTITDAPSEIILAAGGADRSTLTIVPQYGFSGSVTYAAAGLPSGVTAAFSPNPTTGVSTLTLSAGSAATPGASTITITGVSGSITASTTLALTIGSARNTTATTLALTSAGSPVTSITAGAMVTATAAVSAGSTQLTRGEVVFCIATAAHCDSVHRLGSAQLTAAGTATLRFIPGPGTPSYTAVFSGTKSNAPSTSTAAALTVNGAQASTTTMTRAGTAGNYTLTATVTGNGPSAPSGSVSFLDTTNANAVLGQGSLGNATSTLNLSSGQTAATGSYPEGAARGDFNEDGIPDIAVANIYSGITILLGNGDGTFKAAAAALTSTSEPRLVTVGDFNHDGHADLAVLTAETDTVLIFLGNGDGTFTQTGTSPSTGYYPTSLATGDFNGDGLQDLAVANDENNSVSILLGNGDGTFTPSSQTPQTSEPWGVAVADFNGDGVQDFAVTSESQGTVTVFLGNGDGTFNSLAPISLASNSPSSLAAADFNQDGKPDLVVVGYYGTSAILLGNGDGTFTAAANVSTGDYITSIAVADFNQDGFPDFATPSEVSQGLQVFLGHGDGSFSAPINLNDNSYPYGIVAGDWNGDGVPDIAVTNYYGNTLSVFTSQLTQTATATATNIAPVGTGQHAVEASFPGNAVFAASASATTPLTGVDATPTVTLSLSSSSISTIQPVTVTIAVSDGAGNPIPTGAVTLAGGGYTSASAVLSGGSATIAIPAGALTLGVDTLTASYVPDANSSSLYNTASGAGSITVAKATPGVTVSPALSTITTSQPDTVTVAVSGGSGAALPTGTVTLSSGSYTSASTTLTSGSASITIPAAALAAGTDSLTATYAPDANSSSIYTGANGASSITVGKTTPAVTLSLSSGSIAINQPLTVTIAVSPGSGSVTPTGSVTLTSGSYTSAATPLSNGGASIVVPANSLPAGSDTLSVSYAPDSNSSGIFNSASGSGTVSVGKLTPAVTVTPPTGLITLASPFTVTIAVSGSPTATGAVVLSSGSYTSAAATLSGGSAAITIPAGSLPAGTDALNVSYTPDANSSGTYNSATGSATVTIGKLSPSIAIAPSSSSITTVQPVTFQITLSPVAGNPTPTGTVTLTSGSYSSAAVPLTGGAASIAVPAGTLPAGSDALTVAYTPDATSAPTYSGSTGLSSITVSKTTPAVALSLSSSTLSTTQLLTVTIAVNGGSGAPVATGTVTLVSGGWSSAAYPLSNGSAAITIQPETLPAGVDALTATYQPDAASSPTYNGNSGTASVSVATAAPALNLSLSPAAITTIQAVTLTAVVNPGSGNPAPTGTISVSSGTTSFAPAALSNGSASITLPAGSLAAGMDTLTVTYTPDTNSSSTYSSSTGAATLTVTRATPAVTVSPSNSTITTIQPLSVTISVGAGSGSPTAAGAVTLTSGSYTSAATPLTNGNATVAIPAGALASGTDSLTVSYTPDSSTSAIYTAANGSASVTVGKAAPSLALSLSSSAITTLQPLTVTVAASAGSTVPTGTITLAGGGYSSAAIALSNGSAAITIPAGSLAAGSDTLTASYTPDAASASIYSGSTGAVSVAVSKVTPAVTVSPASATITDVQPLNISIAVSAGAATATGSITLTSGSYTSAATPLSNGAAAIAIPAGSLAAGLDSLSVTYLPDSAGSAVYNPAIGSGSVTVGKAAPSLTLTLSSSTITITQPVTVTIAASAGSGSATPTGSITLASGSYTSAQVTLANGSAAITIPAGSLPAGADTLTATYTPDAASASIYSGGTGSGSIAVNKATPAVTVTPSPAAITTNQPLNVTVAVSGGSGNATATGSVTLTAGSNSTQLPLQNGSATFTLAAGSLAAGTAALQATYNPDAASIYTTASQSASVAVTPAATAAVSVAPASSTITYQQGETVAVTVSGSSGTPTGTVTLSSGSYSAQLPLAGGTASFTIAPGALSGGTDTLSAAYSGDIDYAPGGGSSTVTVYPVAMTLPSLAAITPGSTGSGSLQFTASSAYAGSLNLTCALSSSPAGAQSLPTCGIASASLTLAAGASANATFSVSTTAQTAALEAPFGWKKRLPFGGSALAAMLIFVLPRRRRRMAGLLLILLVAALAGATGCAGGGGSGQVETPVTPATTGGSYTFNITAADSGGKFTTTSSVTVIVQ